MTLVGLDLNATRVRVVSGPAHQPSLLNLCGASGELPMALSLEGRAIEVGRAGIEVCRRLPHLACLDFLPFLGEEYEWTANGHRVDATKALGLVFQRLHAVCAGARGLVTVLPAYLDRSRAALFKQLAEPAGLPLLGSVISPLAAALAGYAEVPWSGLALVVDVDDHALTWTAVNAVQSQAHVLGNRFVARASALAWKQRLLDTISDHCIRHSRRDPRDSADAEQLLYEQIDALLDASARGQVGELVIRAAHWCQHMLLRPEELALFSAPLVRQALEGLQTLLALNASEGPPVTLVVTAAAARLPGLLPALQEQTSEETTILELTPDAPARAAHHLANLFLLGGLARSHLDTSMPLSLSRSQGSAVIKQTQALRIRSPPTGTDDWQTTTDPQ
jgi:hypothetical protein